MATAPAVIKFNHQLMAEDMAAKGWTQAEFARRAGVADMTVYRFLDGTSQTPPTAKKLATALGLGLERYIVRLAAEPVSMGRRADDAPPTSGMDQPVLPFARRAGGR